MTVARLYGDGTYGTGVYGQVFGLLDQVGLVEEAALCPHFDLPFRVDRGGHIAVAEQGTLRDVGNCVEAILLTFKGQREEIPDFGINDPTFRVQPIGTDDIVTSVLEQEPRASVSISQMPDEFAMFAVDLITKVSLSQGAGA